MATETTGQALATDFGALLRARNACIAIVSPEELRVQAALFAAASKADYEVRVWDCDGGVTDATGKEVEPGRNGKDIAAVLTYIKDAKKRTVWILKDVGTFLRDPYVARAVRNLAQALPRSPRNEARAMVMLSAPGPDADLPASLADHAIRVTWKLPDREEIAAIFDGVLSGLEPDVAEKIRASGVREAAIEAAVGLSAETIKATYAKSLVTQGKMIVPSVVAAEKKRVVSGKGIDWFDPDPRGLEALGGLENLKPWLLTRREAFSERARAFGLPLPKGIMLVGVPGCGKSLMAKATATAFGCPLLRADFGGAQSKWVGESQENIRKVFALAEAIGKCVLWIDEIEKALAGATSGAADGGVSSDALGTFLSWMQERKGAVFVIATANDVSKMPPELLRKGRFDEMFFVDLPTPSERREIVRVSLKKYGRGDAPVDVPAVAAACDGFTGAEIDAIVPDALFAAFADGERQIATADLVAAAASVVPLSKTSAERITALREWAKGKARPASKREAGGDVGEGRKLDLDA